MLTSRPARRAVGGLLVLTTAGAGPILAGGQPAFADSVRSAQQWVLDAVDAPAAWPVTQGSGVLVAVIDSGVQPEVSDLAGSVTTGPDLSGVGTPSSDANWGMHGTWMASLIAGHGHGAGGADGISGVAPQAKILSIRVLPDKKDPGYAQYKHESSGRAQHALAQAIRYAVSRKASVISMSLGYGASSRVVRAALQVATRNGVVVVASSGNSGTSASDDGKAHAPYSFPADYPGVLGVAAVDRSGEPAKFSSDNLSVQIAAPGVQVPAQGSDSQYWLVSGTSPACALTAGVAALIKAVYPKLAPSLVIRAITVSAQNQPKKGYDDRVGFGTLDAAVALSTAGKLTGFGVTGQGLSEDTHFGGGPKAIPAAPVGHRGSGQLLMFGGLGAASLILSLVAVGRLLLYRRRSAQARHASPPYPALDALPPAPPGSPQSGPAQPGSVLPPPAYPAAPPLAPATAGWTQDNGTRPTGLAPAPSRDQPDRAPAGRDQRDRTLAGPQPPWPQPHRAGPYRAEQDPAGPRLAEPYAHPSSPSPVPPSAAGPSVPGPGAPSPSGTVPDRLAATPPPGAAAPIPWPDDDDAESTSPSGIPPLRAEPPTGAPPADAAPSPWPAPVGSPPAAPPSVPGPVRPGNAPAGSAGPSRHLQGLGRPSPSGRHAARHEPAPAPAWARNRPAGGGGQDADGEGPDPQDDP
jgi:hypothetical protein